MSDLDAEPVKSSALASPSPRPSSAVSSGSRNSQGWDGKLRIGESADEGRDSKGPTPPDSETDEPQDRQYTVVEGEEIQADEDLLADVDPEETEIDLNHSRIGSITALQLQRFNKLNRLCLRQNEISHLHFPEAWGDTIRELDLYDNLISSIKGLESFATLKSLDLSFNKIKHIKRVNHLTTLTDLYFVQNKISKIEGLEGLDNVKNLELAANRIREIENLESLKSLEQLWLGKNKITELKNLDVIPELNILSIQSNRITSPSLAHLANCSKLTDLYLSHNALTTLSTLPPLSNLRTIDISSNGISSLQGLESCMALEEVWASNCQLDSFEEIEKVLGDKQDLTTVYFEGNPLQKRAPALYRNKVRLALPRVKQIDATFVRLG